MHNKYLGFKVSDLVTYDFTGKTYKILSFSSNVNDDYVVIQEFNLVTNKCLPITLKVPVTALS